MAVTTSIGPGRILGSILTSSIVRRCNSSSLCQTPVLTLDNLLLAHARCMTVLITGVFARRRPNGNKARACVIRVRRRVQAGAHVASYYRSTNHVCAPACQADNFSDG